MLICVNLLYRSRRSPRSSPSFGGQKTISTSLDWAFPRRYLILAPLCSEVTPHPPVNVYRHPGITASKCSLTHRPISSTSALGILSLVPSPIVSSIFAWNSPPYGINSRSVKLLLQTNPSINNLNLLHSPIHSPSHTILLPHLRRLISNSFIMLL